MNDDGAKSPICRSAADSRYGFSAERSIGRLGDVISPWFWNCGSLIDDGECRRIEMLVFCEECGCKNLLEETGAARKPSNSVVYHVTMRISGSNPSKRKIGKNSKKRSVAKRTSLRLCWKNGIKLNNIPDILLFLNFDAFSVKKGQGCRFGKMVNE